MSKKRIIYAKYTLVLGLLLIFPAMNREWNIAYTQAVREDKPVEQVRKNIQVLKGMPDSQLFLVMNAVGDSLGVHCDYCHVKGGTDPKTGRDTWLWERDDKPQKLRAREMMKMVLDLNKANFGDRQAVTCYSCHRGETGVAREVPLPPRDFAGFWANSYQPDKNRKPATREAPLPTAEQILKKYVAAVGGENVSTKFKTLVMKGTIERSEGRNEAVEITLKGTDKYLVRLTTAQGVLTQGINGTVGWVNTNDGSRRLSADDLEQLRRSAARFGIIKVTEAPERMQVTGKEIIGGREAYVVTIRIDPNRARRLFFDTETGLLLRQITTTETMLAPLPEQVDFEDYRDVGGVKLPFTIRTSDVASYDTAARRFTEIRHDVAVDDALFEMPKNLK